MRRLQRFLANLLILVFLYSNAAIILNFSLTFIAPGLSLPLPSQLDNLFMLYGMFGEFDTTNHEIEIYGITPSSPSWPRGEIIKLDADDYFPFTRAERLWRICLPQYGYWQDGAFQGEAFAALSAKIRERYNRLNPTEPLEKVVLVAVEWERSLEGYETLKTYEDLTIFYAD